MSNQRTGSTTSHVFSYNKYMGNIIYTYGVPFLTEEELLDVIIEHFPHLKRERWNVVFT